MDKETKTSIIFWAMLLLTMLVVFWIGVDNPKFANKGFVIPDTVCECECLKNKVQ